MRDDHGGCHRGELDFSASINPLGLSQLVRRSILEAIDDVARYPDPRAAPLRQALARYHGVPVASVAAGNGATELLYEAVRAIAPSRALVVQPAFSEYENALESVGARIERLVLCPDASFALDGDALLARAPRAGLVVLANPSNPTGSIVRGSELLELARAIRESRSATLLVDEAFIDWAEDESLVRAASRERGLVVVRSMTKFYALPGLRLGYAVAHPELVERLDAGRGPWSVNALAEAAGLAALADEAYRQRSLAELPRLRVELGCALGSIPGLQVWPSLANFLLLRLPRVGSTGRTVASDLLGRGIAVRDASTFPGLDERWLRVAVRVEHENARLVQGLRDVLR